MINLMDAFPDLELMPCKDLKPKYLFKYLTKLKMNHQKKEEDRVHAA